MTVTVMTLSTMVVMVVVVMMSMVQGTPIAPYPPATPETDIGVTCSAVSRDVTVCRLQGIVRGHDDVNVTVTVNGCHQPVDVTFRMTSSQDLSWNFTFVPNNQNERVYIPGVYLVPPVPVAPTYLYVREPEHEYRGRNHSTEGAFITVEASLVAVLSNNMWEEEEFLNHTFQLPPHCPRRSTIAPSTSPLSPWLMRSLLLAASLTVLLALVAAMAVKRRQLLALLAPGRRQGGDDLTLVQHIEQQQHAQPPSEVASKAKTNGDPKNVINDNNNVVDAGDQQLSEGNPQPKNNGTTQGGGVQDSGVSVISENYSLGSENSIQSVIHASDEIRDGKVQQNLLGRMKKLKESFQVGLKGITFETLKEDQQNLPERENPDNPEDEVGVVIANPLFKSTLDGAVTNNNGETSTDMLPLDDDLSNDAYFYNHVKMGNRSDSYSNIYHQSGGGSTNDVTTTPDGSSPSKLEIMGNTSSLKINNNNNNISGGSGAVVESRRSGGGIISHAAKNGFGYGSREWLDELEGATAAPPRKQTTDKKKKRSQKTAINSKATHGEGSNRGGEEERKNETGKGSSTENSETNGAQNGGHSGAAERSTDGSTRHSSGSDIEIDARKIVKEVLDNGVFDFKNGYARSDSNGDALVTNGHTHAPDMTEACHPLAHRGLHNGGVRPKTSWVQAGVAS